MTKDDDSIAAFLRRARNAKRISDDEQVDDAASRTVSDRKPEVRFADPEDEDDYDRTGARQSVHFALDKEAQDALRTAKRGVSTAFDTEEGVYAAFRSTRADLGLVPETAFVSASDLSDYETFDAEGKTPEASADESEEEVQLIAQRRDADRVRGLAVRRQLAAWQAVLSLRAALQPSCEALARSDCPSAPKQSVEAAEALYTSLLDLFADVTHAPSGSRHSARLVGEAAESSRWRPALSVWHRRAAPPSSTGPQLRLIDRDPCALVDAAMAAEGARLRARTTVRRMNPAGKAPVFDDADFYRVLVRHVPAAPAASTQAAPQQPQPGGKAAHAARRASKGRALRYDVNERIAGFCAPTGASDPSFWPQERISAFFASLF